MVSEFNYKKEGDEKEERKEKRKEKEVAKESDDPFKGNEKLKQEFFEFLASKTESSKSKSIHSEESVSSDAIGGQDPYDAFFDF